MQRSASRPALVAIVGDHLRHRWFAAGLAADPRLDVRGIVSEAKRPRPQGETPEEDELIVRHLEGRGEAERRFFGDAPAWDEVGPEVLQVAHGESNDEGVAGWIREHGARYLALFGCSIIRDPLLGEYDQRVVNMHLGLSPYYRGAATNFWPLVNGEPELVGATIHLASASVDAGPILRQVRPALEPGDGPHDAGCRAIVAGAVALRDALVEYDAGRLEPRPQQPGGRVYKNADFDAAAVRELYRRLGQGEIERYLEDKAARDARYSIVE